MEIPKDAKSVNGQEVSIIHYIPMDTMIGYAVIAYPLEWIMIVDKRIEPFCKEVEELLNTIRKGRNFTPDFNYAMFLDQVGTCKRGLKESASRENFH